MDLIDFLKKNQDEFKKNAVHFINHIIKAVYYMIYNGVVHLDIKPDNFLIDEEKNIFIGDFGSSLRLDKNINQYKIKTYTRYSSPEVQNGARTFSYKNIIKQDIFSMSFMILNIVKNMKIKLPDNINSFVHKGVIGNINKRAGLKDLEDIFNNIK